jgi:type II secretory pathway component PulM
MWGHPKTKVVMVWQCFCIWEKPCIKKIKDGNASIKNTRQMRAKVDTTQRKITKANNE